MKRYSLILSAIFFYFMTNCCNQKNIVQSQELRKIYVDKNLSYSTSNIDYTIEKAELVDKTLKITVSYVGEKNDIEFDLLWNGSIMKSLPPKVMLMLNKKGEMKGKKKVTKNLEFDLQPLIEQTKAKKIVLILKNYQNELIYEEM